MQRRQFITLIGGAAATWPLAARAQQRTPRVGFLVVGASAPPRNFELAHQLARLGYVEGRNITYEIRGADGDANRLPALAREIIATNPDVIVGSTSTAALALAAATRNIPIVMTVISDPIALGLDLSYCANLFRHYAKWPIYGCL